MRDAVRDSMPKKEYQKVAKQIVWIGIIASIMLYAGFTSAVVVSKMDKFWVAITLPQAFTYSTIFILLSSLALVLALVFAKKGSKKLVVSFLGFTLFFGLAFAFSQFKGWSQLLGQGNYIADKIFFDYGAYGNQYVILKNGQEITHDGQTYFLNNKALSESAIEELRTFTHQICGDDLHVDLKGYKIENYRKPYSIKSVSKNAEIEFLNGIATLGIDTLTIAERDELFKFSFGVFNEMPFFLLKGKYGQDFAINLNGERLDFENKKLYFPERLLTEKEIKGIKKTVFQGGKEYVIKEGKVFQNEIEVSLTGFETYLDLNKGIQVQIKDGVWKQLRQELNTIQYGEFYQAGNVASSYVWILTIVHFVHLIIGLILLLVLFIRAIKGMYTAENQLGLIVGGIFWHFLGALWIYLFVFLQYIH